MPSYLWHVVLGIGQGTQELRSVVSDAVIRFGGEHIQSALLAPDPVPG